MRLGPDMRCKTSFGSVIPIKRIVFKDDGNYTGHKQLMLDSVEFQNDDDVDDSCNRETTESVLKALRAILLKNDKAEKGTQENAFNNMIRMSFEYMDKSYRTYVNSLKSAHEDVRINFSSDDIVRPCYSDPRSFLLTGNDAVKYSLAGKNLGRAEHIVKNDDRQNYLIEGSNENYKNCKRNILEDHDVRLKNQYGSKVGLVIYAEEVKVPRAGHKGMKSEIKIKGIDFEAV